jgi:azurin
MRLAPHVIGFALGGWLFVAAPAVASAQAASADTLTLRSRGPELAFFPDQLTVRAGTAVVLRYENGGDLPHNVVIARDDDDLDALIAAAYEAQATGFVPTDRAESMIAYSDLVSPGETVYLSFDAPPPGEYTFICLFPGHANMMIGTLRVVG